jgi:uncharacterized RDD family membrane protein YckC
MNENPLWSAASPGPPLPPQPRGDSGYLSEQAKQKFTITTGILGAVFFLAQLILPYLIWVAAMPGLMRSGFRRMLSFDVSGAVYQDGRVWYLSRADPFGPGPATDTAELMSVLPAGKPEPQIAASLSMDAPALLAGEDRLWIISPEAVGFFRDGQLTVLESTERLSDLSRPFLYGGRPAVIEKRLSEYALQVFEDGQWQEKASTTLPWQDELAFTVAGLQPLADGTTLHLFLRPASGKTLYHRRGIPAPDDEQDSWRPIASAEEQWSAVQLDGRPAAFVVDSSGRRGRVVGTKLSEGRWKRFFTSSGESITSFAVCPTGQDEDFVLVTGALLGSMRVIQVRAGEEVSEVRHGSDFPFPRGFMAMAFVPQALTVALPIVLAFILAGLMRKHRICRYTSGTSTAAFASLSRRAVAQLVDAAIAAGPAILAWISMVVRLPTMNGSSTILARFAWVLAALGWAAVMLFVYSACEGKWGRTPGKWITGIQVVGADLRPCGFGRALVRNLLKLADGFFNFLVGILLVALTENWQRLGDMAARTVVIRSPRSQEPFPDSP